MSRKLEKKRRIKIKIKISQKYEYGNRHLIAITYVLSTILMLHEFFTLSVD